MTHFVLDDDFDDPDDEDRGDDEDEDEDDEDDEEGDEEEIETWQVVPSPDALNSAPRLTSSHKAA